MARYVNLDDGNEIIADKDFIEKNSANWELVVEQRLEDVVLPITDISVNKVKFKIGDTATFDFTTEVEDGTYMMPYRIEGDDCKYLIDVIVLDGNGTLSLDFNVNRIHYIDNIDLPKSELRVNGEKEKRFTIYITK